MFCDPSIAENDTVEAFDNVDVIETVFSNLDTQFPETQRCSDSEPITVREYLKEALVYLSEETENDARIRTECDKSELNDKVIDYYSMDTIYPEEAAAALQAMDKGEPVSQCSLTVQYDSGESVWSKKIQFLMRHNDSTVIESTFRCLNVP
jgi:hypothetical protein